jgi:hypothetical protein
MVSVCSTNKYTQTKGKDAALDPGTPELLDQNIYHLLIIGQAAFFVIPSPEQAPGCNGHILLKATVVKDAGLEMNGIAPKGKVHDQRRRHRHPTDISIARTYIE